MRTLQAQIDEKSKSIEFRQNVTGSYEEKKVPNDSFSVRYKSLKVL